VAKLTQTFAKGGLAEMSSNFPYFIIYLFSSDSWSISQEGKLNNTRA